MAHQIAIIGAGVMAEAIARGLLDSKEFLPSQMIAADIAPARRDIFRLQLGIAATDDPVAAVAGAAIVLLCVKPYQIEALLQTIRAAASPQSLIISIAAGISSSFIEKTLGTPARRVIRAMPNTPMLVGCGMVAIAPGAHATADDLAAARRIFQTAAAVIQTTEDKIDAVTAVSGSGPAYFFYLTEQMIRAGIEMGLSADDARTLAIQTALGAARMMHQSPDAPREHRKRVTTPNGTTHAAISHMESNRWPEITVDALKAAAARSREMGK